MATDERRTAPRSQPGPIVRVYRAWRALTREQRMSAFAALSLWVSMFLPWYSDTALSLGKKAPNAVSVTMDAFGAFSFAELLVLVVSLAVLALLFARGERRTLHLPAADGTLILIAGVVLTLLVFYRMIDKSTLSSGANGVVTTGIQWGIFIALGAAIWIAWTGLSMRRSQRGEAALGSDPAVPPRSRRAVWRERLDDREAAMARRSDARPTGGAPATPAAAPHPPTGEGGSAREPRIVTREDAEQLSFELPPDHRDD